MNEETDTIQEDSITEDSVDESEITEDAQELAEPDDSEDEPDAEPGQPEDEEDTFFDPKDLPDELMPAYKSMQAQWTKKNQEASQQMKDLQAKLEESSSQLERYSKYDRHLPILDEMLNRPAKQDPSSQQLAILEQQLKDRGYSDEAIQLMRMGAEFTLNATKQEFSQQSARQEQERVQSQIEKAGTIDDRLNDTNLVYDLDGEQVTFGQLVGEMVSASPNWTKDPVAATQRAIRRVDALIATAKAEGKKELSVKAKEKTQKFPNVQSSPQSARGDKLPKNIFEAAKMAEEDLGI